MGRKTCKVTRLVQPVDERRSTTMDVGNPEFDKIAIRRSDRVTGYRVTLQRRPRRLRKLRYWRKKTKLLPRGKRK